MRQIGFISVVSAHMSKGKTPVTPDVIDLTFHFRPEKQDVNNFIKIQMAINGQTLLLQQKNLNSDALKENKRRHNGIMGI
jgi:hypothetical protein